METPAKRLLALSLACLLSACLTGDRASGSAYRAAEAAYRAGDFQSSLSQARQGLRRFPSGEPGWKFRLLAAENLLYLSRVREAAALMDEPTAPSDPALRARLQLDRARVAIKLGSQNGPQLLRAALDAALASGDRSLVCMARLRLGDLNAGSAEGESYIRAALADAQQLHDPFLLSWAQLNLGYTLAKAARFDEAVPILDQASETARQGGAKSMLAGSLGNLGWCYIMLGDPDRAEGYFVRAEDLSAHLGMIDTQQRWLGALGNIYMNRGDLPRATSYQQRAAALARQAGNEAWLAIAYNNLAEISMNKGDLPAAQSFNDRALEIKRRLNDDWSLVYSETLAAEIDLLAGRNELARKGYQAVIERCQRAHAPSVLWHAYGRLAFLYQQTGQPALAEVQYRKAIDTIDREWNKLGSDEWKTTFLAPRNLIGFFQDYVDFLIDRGETQKALEVAESSRARVLNQRLEHLGAVAPDFRIPKLLAATRGSPTVILSYWLANRSSVWVLAAGRVSRVELPPAPAIERLVRDYTALVTQGGDPLATATTSSALYEAVLAPVAKLIPPGSQVIVLPDGALHQLAFETLVVPFPQPHYWIEDVTLATAPSLRALQPYKGGTTDTPTLLLMGAPALSGHEFSPLPNIDKEIGVIKAQFQPANRVVLTGARAVPGEYARSSPAKFTNIHFATHATANRDSPLNSAIILSHQGVNYKLYARDVAGLPLRAELVTISACKSAGAKAYSGEGLMGFAWAFLQAGAQNVIATLWDESEAMSADLMGVLYREMAAGKSPASALRAAKLALLHSNSRFRRPYYWGSLQLFTRRFT